MKIPTFIFLLIILCAHQIICQIEKSFANNEMMNLKPKIKIILNNLNANLSEFSQTKELMFQMINEMDKTNLNAKTIDSLQYIAYHLQDFKIPKNIAIRSKRQITDKPNMACSAALNIEKLIEFRTQDLNQIVLAINKTKDVTLLLDFYPGHIFSTTELVDLREMLDDYRIQLEQTRSIASMSFELIENLKDDFKPIINKICKIDFGPCGSFIAYNPLNNSNELSDIAFCAGRYRDGSTAYVGAAYAPDCAESKYLPGRCSNKTDSYGPGCFVTCGQFEYVVKNPIAYLKYHPELKWKSADKFSAKSIANQIIIIPRDYSFEGYQIARIQLYDVFNQYTQVGKIITGTGTMQYANPMGKTVEAYDTFEVLTCESPPVDFNFIDVTDGRIQNNYTDGFESYQVKNNANLLLATINWLLVVSSCLIAWLISKKYQ